ncbi:Serine/threonine protein kinase [Acanthamoeba castellanii str. Neff]|uniref:Serine/threonine protein kinase n=1 Tax=Acanthamoeba castellanii (strain ATCC 30010 / Neff) TaxID=1257118 RepID=L8GV02_ACACF|nr:Serine/threonine protein kinase [Acanthamoeba castellanii str. Neff]ELR17014.1 Serine/threonine protein kinase [Acanthamoeba castellanii str. Neff]
MNSMRHPNVITFYATCTKPLDLCIIMEHMELGLLLDLLKNKLMEYLPLALHIKLALRITKGMHYIHSQGIVHRNLKSPNVLIDSKWNAKVADFGLSTAQRAMGNEQAGLSIPWAAPEILSDSTMADGVLANIYLFGIILWEIITCKKLSSVTRTNQLWELNHSAACKATMIHNALMCNLMMTHNGYEVHMSGLKASMGTGTFCITFHQAIDTVAWWLLCINSTHTKYGNLSNKHFVYHGLRVCMGVHIGLVLMSPNVKAELTDLPNEIGWMCPLWIQHMGNVDLKQAAPKGIPYQLIMNSLEMHAKNHVWFNEDDDSDDCDVLQLPAEDMSLLVSANKCQWFIDLCEIETGKVIGCGMSAIIYRGLWSKWTLPNVLLFISTTIGDKHLLLVTEFVPCGSLASVLANTSKYPLMFTQHMHMAYGTAHGMHYLHSLDLLLLHCDLKLLNLLVDDCLTVKVADFGFVCIKENNATMTNCGMPTWSAPEVIQGLDYGMWANIYLFGVILWEILMCKVLYTNELFMCVVMSIIEGKHPHIMLDCPEALH